MDRKYMEMNRKYMEMNRNFRRTVRQHNDFGTIEY